MICNFADQRSTIIIAAWTFGGYWPVAILLAAGWIMFNL